MLLRKSFVRAMMVAEQQKGLIGCTKHEFPTEISFHRAFRPRRSQVESRLWKMAMKLRGQKRVKRSIV